MNSTPLHYACVHDRPDIVEFIVEEDIKLREVKTDLDIPTYNMKDHLGRTPVFQTSSPKIVEYLLKFEDLEVENCETGFAWGEVGLLAGATHHIRYGKDCSLYSVFKLMPHMTQMEGQMSPQRPKRPSNSNKKS